MRRYQIIPKPDDGKDIGWRWKMGSGIQHWFRSRSGANLAVSHCGLVFEKSLLDKPGNMAFCDYCFHIERMRVSMGETE